MIYDLSGNWKADIGNQKVYTIKLPGTLDENQIGEPDSGSNSWHPDGTLGHKKELLSDENKILTRYRRKYTWDGEVAFSKGVNLTIPAKSRAFLECERARCLKLLIDEEEISEFLPSSLAVPHIFEITKAGTGNHLITLLADNRYQDLPREGIVNSSMATDETQTNWNGILGYFRIRIEQEVFLQSLRVYPELIKGSPILVIKGIISAGKDYKGVLEIQSEILKENIQQAVKVNAGNTEFVIECDALVEKIKYWDFDEGNLYDLTAKLSGYDEKKVQFGMRFFGENASGMFTLNNRTIFLRAEANCAIFPETGHPPMTKEEWRNIITTYKAYGVNCIRFHSYCPPEAAFYAADEMGMLLQPELSHWNPKDAFETNESFLYYSRELTSMLLWLANHPSFVMLTLGNELKANETGHRRMNMLLTKAREIDDTRRYANGSNVHYGEIGCDQESDFYTSMKYYDRDLRGTFSDMLGYINHNYPNAKTNYDDILQIIRETYQKPVISFEVGQYEVLPDFHELKMFKGVTIPENLLCIYERAKEKGILEKWDSYVSATGEISKISYREEVEAALRSKQLAGISLLGLQDFPGQGTALIGMLNSHLKPKNYTFASPDAFHAFFKDQILLVLLSKYTYTSAETLSAEIQLVNYGKEDLEGDVVVELKADKQEEEVFWEIIAGVQGIQGKVTKIGEIQVPLERISQPCKLRLRVSLNNEKCSNEYGIWVYPEEHVSCPEIVYEAKCYDEQCENIIQNGGAIYFTPDALPEVLPNSIKTQFTTDFWSVGTFSGQEGGMGQLIEKNHPVFHFFPTEDYSDWQWWVMASQRAVIIPEYLEAIVTEMDSYATLRHMAQLFECRCGKAKILFSTLALHNLLAYPEARALQNSIYHYLNSADFDPKQEIQKEELKKLICIK